MSANLTQEQCRSAIAVLDRFIEHPEKWNHPVNLWGQPDLLGKGKRCGISGMVSPELIAAAIEERERLTVMLSKQEAKAVKS